MGKKKPRIKTEEDEEERASGLDPEYTYSIFKTYSSHLEKAIEELNRMLEELPDVLLTLPAGGRLPPEAPNRTNEYGKDAFSLERPIYFIIRGDFYTAQYELENSSGINSRDYWVMKSLLQIYRGEIDSAEEEAVSRPPKGYVKDPTVLMVQTLIAVLQLRHASRFIRPIVLCNHLLQLVKEKENKLKTTPQRVMEFLLSTVKGLTSIMMPRIFCVFKDGASLLLDIITENKENTSSDIELSYTTPEWLIATLKTEFFPRLQQKTDEIFIRRCLDCNEMDYALQYVNTLAASFGKKSERYKNSLTLLNQNQ